jgi:glycosyltransferase involved in cell wall biosynthesis
VIFSRRDDGNGQGHGCSAGLIRQISESGLQRYACAIATRSTALSATFMSAGRETAQNIVYNVAQPLSRDFHRRMQVSSNTDLYFTRKSYRSVGSQRTAGTIAVFKRLRHAAKGLCNWSPVRMRCRNPSWVDIFLISRQRIVGNTNGSSAYILSIAEYLRSNGFRVHYVSPSPAAFGRWPFFRLRPEMAVFDSYRIRGSIKCGPFLILPNPKVFWRALIAILDRVLARTGLGKHRWGKPAPHSITVPLTTRDSEFLERHVRGRAGALILDYAFLTPCIKPAGAPQTPTIVIMHDLFSAVIPDLRKVADDQYVFEISETEEMDLLSAADLVVAIQDEEAAVVRDRLPHQRVIVAPMAVEAADHPSPGDSDTVLFVGSNTLPNADGLRWFIDNVWGRIRAARPAARFLVAGSVAWSYAPAVPGVEYLGIVADLREVYEHAGVIVSPLRVGSGLKIKLVEGLGWGKAMVVTPTSVRGVEPIVEKAVLIAENADTFATNVLSLLADETKRQRYAAAALHVASTQFGRDASYGEIAAFIRDRTPRIQHHNIRQPSVAHSAAPI